jgi:RES domain-containing protein
VRLWRISDFADLNGEGGRQAAARWNSRGRPVVYLAEHPALALIENIVHLEIDPDDLPDSYQLIEVDSPGDVVTEELDAGKLTKANANWRSDLTFTRGLGDEWLRSGRAALLRVPSVILPKSTNALLNPAHPDAARAKIVAVTRPPYDRRLFAGH